MERRYDVFISHAGEDKDSLAVPIYDELRRRGIRAFLDRPELCVGEDAAEEMTHAMMTALVGLFILSPEFAAKLWTMKELFCFEERAKQGSSGEGGGGAVCPVLIPVFYRLTVAETRYRLVFKNYPELCVRHGFMDRLYKKEADVTQVLDALSWLTTRTGIECDDKSASTAGSSDASGRRRRLVVRICDEVAKVLEEKFSRKGVVDASSDAATYDTFRPAFYAPENADEVVLDFSEAMSEHAPRSCEAQALREVLLAENAGETVKIVVIKGIAGVGKSCILRGLVRETEVRRRFAGGAYFISLGMDATIETLISELLKVLRISGGHQICMELSDEKSLDVVMERVGRWMDGKTCLMLVDDLWDRAKLGGAIVPRLAGVLSTESASTLVITTRFDSVSMKGKIVEITPRDPMSKEARNILMKYAGFTAAEVMNDSAVRRIFKNLLRMCGGLPVCLAVMGCGLRRLSLALRCRGVEVWELYHKMMEEGEKLMRVGVGEYKCLRTTLLVSLRVLEEGQGKYETDTRLSWAEMHRSFCIMQKQAAVSVQVFARMWGLANEYKALELLQEFSGVGLISIEVGKDDGKAYVRLHDLLHDFSVLCARSEREESKWHGRVLDGYIRKQGEGKVREWWNVEDDGYVYENIRRHLVMSGNTNELIELLLSRGWTEARLEQGGLVSWNADFEECIKGIGLSTKHRENEKEELKKGLQLVRDAVVESWRFVAENRWELGFQVDARLRGCGERLVLRFLESVRKGEKTPCARALGRWWGRPGGGDRGGEFALNGSVFDIALHDERRLAMAGVGCNVVVIDLKGMRVMRTCAGHAEWVVSVAFSSDGTRMFSWSKDGVLRAWDVDNGKEVLCVSLKDGDNENDTRSEFLAGAMYPDGNVMVTGSQGGMVEVWDTKTGKREGEALGDFEGPVRCVSISRDGRRIAAGGDDGTFRVWDLATRAQVGSARRSHETWVSSAAFSADGRLVVSGSGDMTIRVWDVESGTQRGSPIRGHTCWSRCISFSEDGRHIVSGGEDTTVRIWDAATGAGLGRSLRGHRGRVRCVSMTRDSRFVISGGDDDTVRVWDLAVASDGAEKRRHGSGGFRSRNHYQTLRWEASRTLSTGVCRVSSLDAIADGRWFISGWADGSIRVYDGSSGEQVGDALREHRSSVSCVAASSCGQRFMSGSSDGALCVWKFNSSAKPCVWEIVSRIFVGAPRYGHKGGIKSLEMLAGNVLRSVDKQDVEMKWRLDDQHGLVQLSDENAGGSFAFPKISDLPSQRILRANSQSPGENEGVQEGSEGGLDEVVCEGRQVCLRGGDTKLATLPARVSARWRYNGVSGVVGMVLEDNRVLFLRVER